MFILGICSAEAYSNIMLAAHPGLQGRRSNPLEYHALQMSYLVRGAFSISRFPVVPFSALLVR